MLYVCGVRSEKTFSICTSYISANVYIDKKEIILKYLIKCEIFFFFDFDYAMCESIFKKLQK